MKSILLFFLVSVLSLPAFSQWTTSSLTNTVVMNAAGCLDDSLENPKARVITDAAGNFFVTWSDNRFGIKNVFVQKFNASGVAQWTANGIRVAGSTNYQVYADVAADDAGGCAVVWADTAIGSLTSFDIKAQMFNSSGTAQWTIGGVTICNATNQQKTPKIISDGGGGYYTSWCDERTTAGVGAMYIQRINSSGVSQLTANGVLVTGSFVFFEEQHFLLKEGTNAVIVYGQYNGSDFDIKAQKYNTAGAAQWGATGINVVATANEEAYLDAAIDNSGNTFVSWESYAPPNYDVSNDYVQKINSAGTIQWAAGGVVASAAVNDQFWPSVGPDNAGGVSVTWEDYSQDVNNSISDIYMQKFNSAGTAAFAANGIVVCNAANEQYTPRIVSDGSGGSIISYPDFRTGTGIDIYTQRMNSSGVAQWTANGVVTANAANYQAGQNMVVSNSGVIIGFYDDRTTPFCSNLYLQRINFDGTLGNLATGITNINPLLDKIKVYPTLMHSTLIIENNNSFAVDMRMMDMNGKIVLNQKIAAGTKITTSVNHLAAGVYMSDYTLKDGRRVKLPLMKQ